MLKRNRFIIVLAFSVMMLVSPTGQAYAKTSVDVTNNFETGIVDIGIKEYQITDGKEELWKDNPIVLPGDKVSKIPRVYNYGADCYVRVKIAFRETEEITEEHLFGISDKWLKADDGYYYYTEILKSGKDVDVFQGLRIPEEISEEMSGKSFYLDISLDAIQSKNFTPDFKSASPWGSIEIMKCEKEGQYDISTFKKSDNQSFKIEYRGDTGKLVKNKDDFFMNFPYLMPGDKYSDRIEIENSDKRKDVKLYFRSEAKDDSELLDKIMLRITTDINGEQKEVYYGSLRAAQLSEDILLGVIKKNSKGVFYFEIEVPAELNNKYTILDSYVKWIFSTEPIKENKQDAIINPITGKPVQTGDTGMPLAYASLMAASTVILMTIYKKRRADDHET